MVPAIDTLENLVNNDLAPSVQYVFFDEDKILYEFRKGYANIDRSQPVGDETVFPVFSITKTFTALAVLQLVEKGLIHPDARVFHYLPELPLHKSVTVKHLLTHTASLGNPLPLKWIHTPEEHPYFNRNAYFKPVILKSIRKNKLPGIKFSYSNIGYIILGQIIEAVSKCSYEAYVTSHILDSLKTEKAILSFEMEKLPMATGYHKNAGFSLFLLKLMIDSQKFMRTPHKNWRPFVPLYLNGTPYGGLFANKEGIVIYGQEMLKTKSKLISDESKESLFTENLTNDGNPTGMCLAWYKGILNGNTYYSHAGGGGGFYCELRIYPELNRGSFIILNRSGFSDARLLSRIDQF